MSPQLAHLTNQILTLAVDERVILAQKVWDSVSDFVDPDVEQAWLEVADQRWRDIQEGKVQCVPAEKVFADIRAKLST